MRKWLVVLMTAAAVGATGLLGWMYVSQDRKGPEITIDESKKGSYTEGMTAEELLDGVKATDDKDGDVSDTLTVENVYPNEQGDEVTVIYVAKDKSNNVTKVTYHMTPDAPLSRIYSRNRRRLHGRKCDRTSAASNTAEPLVQVQLQAVLQMRRMMQKKQATLQMQPLPLKLR